MRLIKFKLGLKIGSLFDDLLLYTDSTWHVSSTASKMRGSAFPQYEAMTLINDLPSSISNQDT